MEIRFSSILGDIFATSGVLLPIKTSNDGIEYIPPIGYAISKPYLSIIEVLEAIFVHMRKTPGCLEEELNTPYSIRGWRERVLVTPLSHVIIWSRTLDYATQAKMMRCLLKAGARANDPFFYQVLSNIDNDPRVTNYAQDHGKGLAEHVMSSQAHASFRLKLLEPLLEYNAEFRENIEPGLFVKGVTALQATDARDIQQFLLDAVRLLRQYPAALGPLMRTMDPVTCWTFLHLFVSYIQHVQLESIEDQLRTLHRDGRLSFFTKRGGFIAYDSVDVARGRFGDAPQDDTARILLQAVEQVASEELDEREYAVGLHQLLNRQGMSDEVIHKIGANVDRRLPWAGARNHFNGILQTRHFPDTVMGGIAD